MYNKTVSCSVQSVTPFATNEGDDHGHGVSIKVYFETADREFLSDITGDKAEGAKSLMDGVIPAESVDLKFSPSGSVLLELGTLASRATEITAIQVLPKAGFAGFNLTLKCSEVTPAWAGAACLLLRESDLDLTIKQTQKQLFDDQKIKDERRKRQEADDVTDGRTLREKAAEKK